jgi:AcrR family transcriptional regulator
VPVPKPKPRNKITDALMALAAERRWEEVTLEALAERAGVTLSALRASYDGRLAVLADFVRSVDEHVLAGIDPSLATDKRRERLFDLLYARFEVLAPHKQAIRNLGRAAMRDPLFALCLNNIGTTSMVWMLAAAGVPAQGLRGMLRAQALAVVWGRVMRVWLSDNDPGLGPTMEALDKRLREAERAAKRLDRLEQCFCPPRQSRSRTAPTSDVDLSEGHPS